MDSGQDRTGGGAASAGLSFTTVVGGSGQAFVAGRDIVFQGPVPRAMAALPAAPPYLVGRAEQLGALTDFLAVGAEGLSFTPVALVSGFAGSGKTALAVAAARTALQGGGFAGGVVFVDLGGYGGAPLDGSRALASALRSLGVRPADLAESEADRAGLYRSLLHERATESGPVLVIADNASAVDQVTPLIPGGGEHRLLAISRQLLPVTGARTVVTGPLEPAEAHLLLHHGVGRVGLSRSGTVESLTPQTVGPLNDLVELSGFLPAAVIAIAHQFSQDPGLTAAELRHRLRSDLDAYLAGGPAAGPVLPAVRHGFDDAYLRLGPEAAALLPLLALVNGPDFTTRQVGCLAEPEWDDIRARLAALARAHLLVEEPVGSDRWRLPAHARREVAALAGRLPRTVRENAQQRLLDEYARMARTAAEDMRGTTGSWPTELRIARAAAQEWLDRERPNLTAAVSAAVEAGLDRHAAALAVPVAQLLVYRRLLDDLAACTKAGLAAAARCGDRAAEAELTQSRGMWLRDTGKPQEALAAFERARGIFTEIDDRKGRAKALGNVANIHYDLGDLDRAYTSYRDVASEFHELGDSRLEAQCLKNAGNALVAAEQLAPALRCFEDALAICKARTDLNAEAEVHNALGEALQLAGRPRAALEHYDRAARIGEAVGDPALQGAALAGAGVVLALGTRRERHRGIALMERAVGILEDSGDRRLLALVCHQAGLLLYENHNYAQAFEYLHRSGLIYLFELDDTAAAGDAMGLMDAARRAKEQQGLAKRLLPGPARRGHTPASDVAPARIVSVRQPQREASGD
ncbi:tetratricopeptide repeat protein [Streptomyces sp. NPDC092296]|uniref:tetratricopeptide repeat protein n=1 Tax=Streptomyces sp. NPDC092296 TaxID=3366012 RepID=UPI00381346D8